MSEGVNFRLQGVLVYPFEGVEFREFSMKELEKELIQTM